MLSNPRLTPVSRHPCRNMHISSLLPTVPAFAHSSQTTLLLAMAMTSHVDNEGDTPSGSEPEMVFTRKSSPLQGRVSPLH